RDYRRSGPTLARDQHGWADRLRDGRKLQRRVDRRSDLASSGGERARWQWAAQDRGPAGTVDGGLIWRGAGWHGHGWHADDAAGAGWCSYQWGPVNDLQRPWHRRRAWERRDRRGG